MKLESIHIVVTETVIQPRSDQWHSTLLVTNRKILYLNVREIAQK